MENKLQPAQLGRIRRSRRHPRLRQYDYLHLARLNEDLGPALAAIAGPGERVLDIWCGSRPYDDMYAPGVTVVGLDITDSYGTADIVSTEFLPGEDGGYDGASCIEAWHYVRDPVEAAAELRRVVRPGGRIVVSAPLVYEYDRTTYEHRFTTQTLRAPFEDWDDVQVLENGGRAISWTWLTCSLLHETELRLVGGPAGRLVPLLFGAVYCLMNALGRALDVRERHRGARKMVLPPNLLLTAVRPAS
jgi:SAM-dependent methyltransferase